MARPTPASTSRTTPAPPASRAVRTGPPPAVRAGLRRANRAVRLLLRSRLHPVMSRRFLVITYAGARTGRSYATPVMYLHDGDALLVAGGAPWWRNLRHGSTVSIRLRGRERRARVELVIDPDDLARSLAAVVPHNRLLSRFMRLAPGPDGALDPGDVARARARGLTVVRLHPDGEVRR